MRKNTLAEVTNSKAKDMKGWESVPLIYFTESFCKLYVLLLQFMYIDWLFGMSYYVLIRKYLQLQSDLDNKPLYHRSKIKE